MHERMTDRQTDEIPCLCGARSGSPNKKLKGETNSLMLELCSQENKQLHLLTHASNKQSNNSP